MKRKLKVALNMHRLTVPEKINKARFIVSSMTNNSNFSNPTPSLINITQAIDKLETAWNKASDGGKTKKKLMRTAVSDLMDLMIPLSHYVEDTADGNEEKIVSSGMDIKASNTTRSRGDFWVDHGKESGSVIIKTKVVLRSTYHWEISPDAGDKSWRPVLAGTRSRVVITSLTPGQKYWFRVKIINKEGAHPYTEPISLIVV